MEKTAPQSRIEELETRLAEAEQLIEAIKAGEVDAFALNKNNRAEIYTLQSGDFAYRLLIENFNEGAVNLSEDGLIVYTNNYFHQLLGLAYDQVIGHHIFEFIHPSSETPFKLLFAQGVSGQSKGEINLSAGEVMIVAQLSLSSLRPTLPTVGMIITDLTEKKRSEKDLASAYYQLAQKNEALEKSNIELASFSYVASHDLQEPLRKIQTLSSLLLQKESSGMTDNAKMIFGRVMESAKRMQSLIQDLLAYSRISATEGEPEMCNLNQIIDEVQEELAEELVNKQARVDSTADTHLMVIPFQFRQLLYNLIQNALKFSKADQTPVVTIKSEIGTGKNFNMKKLLPEKKYCYIVVSDNGIGFEPDYSEKIFELFQRLHDRSEYEGTGIGLSIVKRIVENHQGHIMATGKPDEGAAFHIYIPID